MSLDGLDRTSHVSKLRKTKHEERTNTKKDEDESAAMASLNEAIISPLVPALPRSKGQYTHLTVAYDKQIGFILLHEQEDGSNLLLASSAVL